MYFRNYRLWKIWLDHSIKGAVSEHALTVNIWKCPKHIGNLLASALIIFFIIVREVDFEWSPQVLGEILGLFFKTLTADGKCPVWDCENLPLPIQIQISKQQQNSSKFFLHFYVLHQILNILKEKLILRANVFPKLQTVKIFVREFSKEHTFRKGFGSQHVKAFQMLAKSPWQGFYHVFLSFSRKLIWKLPPLVLCQILEEFFNTLTADGKYPVQDCENFQLPIQIQLSEKQNGLF